MKFSFKVGDRITTKSLGQAVTTFVKSTRFFLLTFRKGDETHSAVYQMIDSKGKQRVGTTFLLSKLFGDKKLPVLFALRGGDPLPCEVELIDHYNLAAHAIKYNTEEENKTLKVLDIAFALSL